MRTRTFATLLGVALLTTIAVAQNVTYDFDKSADFSKLETYTWGRGTPVADALNHKRIVGAIEAQLMTKGMARIDAGAADAVVAYHASFDRDLEINGFATGWGPYRFGGARSGTARVDEILVGTLVIDIVDTKKNEIVWRGTAVKDIDVKASAEKRDKGINKAAEKLFKNYPPHK